MRSHENSGKKMAKDLKAFVPHNLLNLLDLNGGGGGYLIKSIRH
jgi:hypothetical protein